MADSNECFMAGEPVETEGSRQSSQRERIRPELLPWSSGLKVVITGGCGFLGIHIARLLYKEGSDICITLLDVKPPLNNEKMSFVVGDINNGLRIHYYRGDVLIRSDLTRAFRGADIVIHCAANSDTKMTSNWNSKMEAINKIGTKNVVSACQSEGVKVLINAGSIFQAIYNGVYDHEGVHEDTPIKRGAQLIMDTFGTSKNEGESTVLIANGTNGVLYTCSLRIPPLYGEYDTSLIPSAAYVASKLYGYYPRIGKRSIKMNVMYVENAAHSFVCAAKKLIDHETRDKVGGHYFYITDDTRFNNYSEFFGYYLKSLGYHVNLNIRLPVKLVTFWLYMILTLLVFIMIFFDVRDMAGLLLKYHHQAQVLTVSHSFSRRKAKQLLDYEPTITFELASKKSLHYYYGEYHFN